MQRPRLLARAAMMMTVMTAVWVATGSGSGLFWAAAGPQGSSEVQTSESSSEVIAQRLLDEHNRVRDENGLEPLSLEPTLTRAARLHAQDMRAMGSMQHEGSDGSKVGDRVGRLAYPFRRVGENVAVGQRSAQVVVEAWMTSPPHRKNILGDYDQMGAGVARDDDGRPYWCVVFGTPRPILDPERGSIGLLEGINRERRERNRAIMVLDPVLEQVARDHIAQVAEDDELKAGGRAGDGKTPFDRLGRRTRQYRQLALSFAVGPSDPETVIEMILNNRAQRKEVLGPYNRVGIGCAASEQQVPYWCIILGRSDSSR